MIKRLKQMKIIRYTTILLSLCCMAGCARQLTMNSKANVKSAEHVYAAADDDIPYIIAEHYFVRNDLHVLPPKKIVSEAELNANFGMAAVMGTDGMPAKIDFSHQYVISVTLPETNLLTEIVPISLKKTDAGGVVFTYQIKRGEKSTYTTIPLLLIIVESKYDGALVLNPVEHK